MRILVPLDGSELADRVLARARPLLERGSEVVLLTVVPRGAATARALATAHLDARRAALAESGAVGRVLLAEGEDPGDRVVELARELGPELVLLSSHGRSGHARLHRGAVAERVLRHCGVPVLLARARSSELPLARIVLPLDRSEQATAAFPLVRSLARATDAAVTLLHVLPERGAPEEEVRAWLGRLRERLAPVPVTVAIEHGDPAAAIVDAARGAVLVVQARGAHDARFRFGSVAEVLIRRAASDLLVVPSLARLANEADLRGTSCH